MIDKTSTTTIDDYLQSLTDEQKSTFAHIAKIVRQISEVEELVSYGVPTFKYKKRPLLYFGAFKDHMSLYPASDGLIEAVPGLEAFRTGKGTLQFTGKQPIGDELIKAMIHYRKSEIDIS